MQQSSTFQVYNASAGSGKTFTLVKEYFKVLLSSEDIFTFQKVLAITFTNKAAGEMKERVLSNLEDFSKNIENDLYQHIIEETLIDKEVLQQRSSKVLDAILQNYSAFSITTIDSFTHKIIKSFAYDLGLPLNFEVEMDAVSLLNEAVDLLISKIGTDKDLTKLLIEYSLDKTDADKSWDISKDLNEFAKILLNEEDNLHFKKLSDKQLSDFTNLKTKLFSHQKELKKELVEIAENCLEIIANAGLEHKDFLRGTIPKFFNDIKLKSVKIDFIKRSITIDKAIDNNQFYAKSTSEEIATTIDGVVPEVIDCFIKTKQIYRSYLMNELALKSIIPLAVLNNVNNELSVLKEENNIRLNAEFNQLISDNIKEQPAPFIYERIGQRFMHYFIDEMQDTSVLQWQNLIPLIDNALAQENSNLLLVGDGKQAIYRWRGGKAEQFINLGAVGKHSENPFHVSKTSKTLETNYRSYSEIINFNNQFFQHTSKFLQNDAYKNIFIEGNKQQLNSKKGGCITLSFLEKEQEKEAEKVKYPAKVLEKINQLKNSFLLNEICVLTRTKKDGVAVANYLAEHQIDIVSSETLLLKNNVKIKFIINFLQIIQNPNDEEIRFELLYFLHHHLQVKSSKDEFLRENVKLSIATFFKNLVSYGASFDENKFYQLPFYEKIEEIIRSFYLVTSSDAYIQFFLDIVLEQQRKGTSTQDFLEFWELKKDQLSIVAPENGNAVQIMTIHKSKGLEFPVVIFPCDVDIYRQIKPKVWFNHLPESFGFEELLIDFKKDISFLNNTGEKIYKAQREELELDNINLLYVALTRAVEQLHIITEKKISAKGDENLNFYSGIFINFLKEKNLWQENKLEYCFGERVRISEKENVKSISEIHQKFISTPWQQHNIILLASASKLWNTNQKEAIDYGNLLHEIFSKIYTQKDIDKVVDRYFLQGVLKIDKVSYLKQVLKKVISNKTLEKYFKEGIEVYNEREIVTEDNQIIIPDRLVFFKKEVVIIDYKTGKPSKKYHQQLLKYQQVLERMSFKVSKKILVYIDEEILVEEL